MSDYHPPVSAENAGADAESQKPTRLKHNLQRPLPPDFYQRIASKVVLFFERDTQVQAASKHLQGLLMRNVWSRERLHMCTDAIMMLLDTDEENVFAGLSLLAISSDEDDETASAFFQDVLQHMIEDHYAKVKPNYDMDSLKHFTFGYYGRLIGDGLISLALINHMEDASLYFYSRLIRQELSKEGALLRLLRVRNDIDDKAETAKEVEKPHEGKSLFDEVIDFVATRAQVSETLRGNDNQAAVNNLADHLRSARAYVIQSLIDDHMMQKRRETLKELNSRAASAEDLMFLKETTERALKLFFLQRQYPFYFTISQKLRLFLKSFAAFWGIGTFLLGYFQIGGVLWWHGLVVALGTFIYGRIITHDRVFKSFLPQNYSSELEMLLASVAPIVRKTTFSQMDHLILHLLHEPDLHKALPVLPEFMRYLFYVIPSKNKMLLKHEEIAHLLRELDFESSSRKHIPNQPAQAKMLSDQHDEDGQTESAEAVLARIKRSNPKP